MGVLRLFLATLVVFSHMGYTVYGYNPGVVAVVVFYLLAGQVVAKLWFKAPVENRFKWFMRDRSLRILPAYYVSLVVVTLAWAVGLLAPSYFLSHSPSAFDWFANISILPMNYFMFNGTDRFALLPTVWSLAVEVQFYLLVPILLSFRVLWRVAAVLSLLVFGAAQLGWLHPDYFGYRLLPGVLWIFLSGTLLGRPSPRNDYVLSASWALCCSYTTYLLWSNQTPSYVLEVALGYVLGIPILLYLRQNSLISTRAKGVQRLAGAYSYPLFLIHLPIIWCINKILGPTDWDWVLVLIACLIYAMLIHHIVELKLWRYLRPRLNL